MATAKVLQTPAVIQIIGSSIRVSHPSTSFNTRTYARSPIAAGATAFSVGDNTNIANGDQLVIGTIGIPLTESVLVNGSVTLGSSLTLASTLAFSHDVDCEVFKVYERSVIFYGTNDGVTFSAIKTQAIQWDKSFTEYTLLTTDTAYANYGAAFTDGTTIGNISGLVVPSGLSYHAVENFIQQALDITNSDIDENLLSRDMLVRWMQDAQSYITQFTYQDPTTGAFKQKDWSWEVLEDNTSITLSLNENEYALSSLLSLSKYPNSQKSIIDMRIGSQYILAPRSIDEFDQYMAYKPHTKVATTPSVGATSLVLIDASEFAAGGGTVTVGPDILTYTGVTGNTLTGIPASSTGSITTGYAVGTSVWQNIISGKPSSYTIFNGTIKLDRPISSLYAGQKLKIRYLYAIPRITSVSDSTVIPFTNVFQYYLAAKIERRKGNSDQHAEFMDMFQKSVLGNALADMVPVNDEWKYHNYNDDFMYDGLNLNPVNFNNFQ